MMNQENRFADYREIVAFHGHSCPGLAMGWRMARAAMDFLVPGRSVDEELVAVVENNACGVDALQCLSGCTFGKGNLIFKDYGKMAYIIYSRTQGRGVRVVLDRKAIPEAVKKDRQGYVDWLLREERDDFLALREVCDEAPPKARILDSLTCAECGEAVMATRIREDGGRQLCIPCYERLCGRD